MSTSLTKKILSNVLAVLLSVFLLIVVLPVQPVRAATITSTSTGGAWNLGTTWVGGVAPLPTDSVVIATTGSNSVTFDAAKVLSGSITIDPGATLATNNFALTLGGDLINNGTFSVGSSNITFNGTLDQSISGFTTTGTVSMTKTGGTAALTGDVIAGALTINGTGGTLNLAGSNVNTGAVTLTAGTIAGTTGILTGTSYSLQTGTVSAILGGAGAATKTTAGIVTLSGENTFSGGLTLNAGTLNINNAAALGSGAFTITGGTINNTSGGAITLSTNNPQNWNGNFTFTGTSSLNLGVGAVTMNANRTVTANANTLAVGGVINGTFRLTKAGNGALTLNAANTHSGTTLTRGILNLGNAQALGNPASTINLNGGSINNTTGAALTLANYPYSIGGNFTFVGSNALNLGTGAVALTAARTLTVTANTLTIDGVISGAFRLTKAGNGALTLNAANTHSGTTLSAGVLNLGNAQALGNPASTINLNGGSINNTIGAALTLANYPYSIGGNFTFVGSNALNLGTGAVTLTGNRQITVSASTLTVDGVVSGAFRLTKAGNGALTLNAVNTHSGTTLSAGILNIGNAQALGNPASTINLNGGSINNTTGAALTLANYPYSIGGNFTFIGSNALNLGTGAVTLTAARTVTVTANNLTIDGVISGAFRLTKSGPGALTLSGANTFTGGVTLSAGTLNINNSQALGTAAGTFIITGGVLDNTSGAAITTLNYPQNWNGNFTFTGTNNLNLGTGAVVMNANRTVTVTANTLTVGGVISGAARRLTKAGAGALTLSGVNTFTGGTTLSAGTLNINNSQALGTAAGTFIITGGVLDNTSGAAITTLNYPQNWNGNFTFTGTNNLNLGTGAVVMNANRTVTVTANNLTVGGVISGAARRLTKDGNGALTLSGANTFTGGTTLNAGILNINNSQALGAAAGTFIITGGVLDNTSGAVITTLNYPQTWNGDFAFTGTNNLNLGTGAVTLGADRQVTVNAGVLTVGGVVTSGPSNLTKAGAGTLNFGANAVTLKDIVISAGTLGSTSGVLNLTGNFTNNGLFVHQSGTVNFNGTSAQAITGGTVFHNLSLNNASGLTLNSDATVDNVLTFANGKISTGANKLILGASGTISGADAGKYVYGNLQKAFNTGAGQSFTFAIGDAMNYTPATLTAFNVTTAGEILANTTPDKHPQYSGTQYVNRYWTLTPGGGLATGGYNLTVTFVAGDLVGLTAPLSDDALQLDKCSKDGNGVCTWTASVKNSTGLTITGTGFTSFSDFFGYGSGTTTPVTLSYFMAERQGGTVNFAWSTATETGNVGFNLYVEQADGSLQQINPELIASAVIDSLAKQDYQYSAVVAGDVFYIEDIDIQGEARRHGPFELGSAYGAELEMEQIDQESLRQELGQAEDARQQELLLDSAVPAEALADPAGVEKDQADEEALRNLPALREKDILPILRTTFKFKVNQTGLYRVSYETLRDAGLDLAGVPTHRITLLNRGMTTPIHIEGGVRFGPGSYIEFYGQALDTIYTDTNVYTLQVGNMLTRRVQLEDWAAADETKAAPEETNLELEQLRSAEPAGYYQETLRVNKQRQFANYAPGADTWYDTSMLTYTSAKSWNYAFSVDGLVDGASAANLELVVWGVTNWPDEGPDHHLQVSLNGVLLADEQFDGLAEKIIRLELPAGLLRAGANTLTLTLPGDSGFDWDMINFDQLSLTYPREFRAQAGQLRFTAQGEAFSVSNLPEREVLVYRIDAAGQPTRVQRLDVAEAGDGTYRVRFGGTEQPASYLVTTVSAVRQPQLEITRAATKLNQRADYLIISHPSFIKGLAPLVAARRAQGLKVSVVDVNDLYGQYTQGIFDPQAIREYIAYAARNLGTKYVLLVGGDTYDYRNYTGRNSVSFIPSLYIATGPIARVVPVDPLYTDLNGDNLPDLAIGRFPVRSQAELDLLVQKTLAYESKRYGQTAVFASDKSDQAVSFKAISTALEASLPTGWAVESLHLDDLAVTDARQQLLDTMNRGTALVTFTGHSGPTSWTFSSLFTTSHAAQLTNAGKPFVAVQWGCWNTYYVDPVNNYLVQSLLFSGDRGAAAALGAVTLTDAESERLLGELLTPRMVQPGVRLGDALQQAKTELAQTHPELLDVLLGWTLMGDPALSIVP